MTDLDQELSALGTIAVPDRWDEIVARATEPEPMVIEIGPLVDRRSRRLLAIATAILVVAGLAVLLPGRGGDGGGVATAPPRPANEPALLDVDREVQPNDLRALSGLFSEVAPTTGIVLGQPTDAGYRHLVALGDPAPEDLDFAPEGDRTQRLLDDPIPGSDLYLTEVEGRNVVQGTWTLEGRELLLASIAPLDAVRELIRDLDRVPTEVGETIGPWEVVEISTAGGSGTSTYAEVTTTYGGRRTHLVSNPASLGGALGGFVFLDSEVERVEVDGRTAWYGPRLPALTWSVPGGGSATLFRDGTADELVAIAEQLVERSPEEWAERGGTFPDDVEVVEAPTTTTTFAGGDALPTLGGPRPPTAPDAVVTAPRPEVEGWTTTIETYRLGDDGAHQIGWLLERDGVQVALNLGGLGQPADPPEEWDEFALERDDIRFFLDEQGALSLWEEPGVGVAQMIAIREPDRALQLDLVELLTFTEAGLDSIPTPQIQPRGDEQVELTGTVDGRLVELQVDPDGSYHSFRFDGFGPTTFWAGGFEDQPVLELAAVDGTAVVLVHLTDDVERVSAGLEGAEEQVSAPIATLGDQRIALVGIEPSVNGLVSVVVIGRDTTWTFDLPTVPMGWVDGVLTPTG
ncbi:MAG: hypothetical protein AAFZ07_13275 [Actinomycetota bacterium]